MKMHFKIVAEILRKILHVVLALFLETIFLWVGHDLIFGRSHGRIVDARYRNKERIAAYGDYHYHPSPEATARFQEELRLMHEHEDWKWRVGDGLFFALNGVWIYYYFRHKHSTTTPNKLPEPLTSNTDNLKTERRFAVEIRRFPAWHFWYQVVK